QQRYSDGTAFGAPAVFPVEEPDGTVIPIRFIETTDPEFADYNGETITNVYVGGAVTNRQVLQSEMGGMRIFVEGAGLTDPNELRLELMQEDRLSSGVNFGATT